MPAPDIGVSSIVSPVRPSTTGAEAITFDRPFEHDKKLPVLADVVRTPFKKKWNAASLLRFALASRLLRIMLCSAAAVGGICSRNSSIPSTERFECRKRHEPSIKMDVIPLSTAAEPDGWMDWCWEGLWRPLDARFTTAKSERAILANSGHSPQLYFILQP